MKRSKVMSDDIWYHVKNHKPAVVVVDVVVVGAGLVVVVAAV